MTVNPRVNPKKLRPYDQPPRRRRTLIPSAPDSGAIGFLVVAGLWLALAGALGLLAIGLKFVPFEISFGLGVFNLAFELDARRVDYAFVNAAVYGWLTNAGFAAICFITPRLTGRRLALEPLLFLGLLAYNAALLGGIAGLYVFDLGPHAPLTAMMWVFDGGMAAGAFVVTASLAITAVSTLRTSYVSIWFAGVAVLSLLGLLSLNALGGILDWVVGLDDVFEGLASVFIQRATVTMWLLGMTYATLHYVVPRAVLQPLASGGVALLTFLTWLALAPASALATLVDVSVPVLVTTLGEVATMALFVPAALAVGNLAATMQGRWSVLFGTGAGALAAVALVFLLGTSLLESIGALREVRAFVGRTDWVSGLFIWSAFGTFTFAALALGDHALPRVLKRAWGGGMASAALLWLTFAGATIAGLALMGGGLAEGSLLATQTPPDEIRADLFIYRAIAFGAFGLVALGGLALLTNLFMLYTTAEPVEYVVPGQQAAAPAGH
jgi:cytochrome c oxidase cbb3-type subunit 1